MVKAQIWRNFPQPGADLTAASQATLAFPALASPILVMGAPRSGTTWLAKIIDSHPDVLYRHEPDAMLPGPSPLTPEALPGLLADWAADQSLRSAAKQPFFAKSWQPGWARWLRTLLAFGTGAAAR